MPIWTLQPVPYPAPLLQTLRNYITLILVNLKTVGFSKGDNYFIVSTLLSAMFAVDMEKVNTVKGVGFNVDKNTEDKTKKTLAKED